MPTFLIELNDGRKFQVEANRQPTPEEAMSLIGGGQIAPSESKPYLSQLGEALSTGYGQMTSGVGATFNAITGDVPDVAENLAEMGRLQRKQQSSRSAEDIALAEDFARSKEAYEMSQGPLEAMEALGGYLGATARNPGAAFKQAVQSAPNALIGGATELAGYGLGGLLGLGAGIETGPGAILTGIAGASAGGAISNSLMEAGPAIYDILNEKTGGAAANMTAGEITAYLNQNPDILSEGLKTGAIRGSVIGLVEGLGLKGAGALATIPERAAARAVQKTLVDAGVDVASKEAIETAVKNPTIFAAVKQAGETAKQQFSSAGNLARMAGAAGIEVGSSGVGELGAQVATGQPVNPTDIYQEMLGEAALSLPVAAAGKALEARKYILPSKVEEAMPPPPPEIEVASDALNATANVPFTDISGQAASDTIAQNTELAMRMPVQPVEEVEEVEEVAEDSADPEFLQKRWQSLEDSALAVIEAGAMDRLPAIRDEQARLAKRIARITAMKTPSPEMEMPEKPSQTITGSNVQTGTEMPVPGKSTVTSPGEAPLVTPEEKKSADNAEVEPIEPTVENIKVPTSYVTGNGGQRGEIVAENGDRITVEWRDGTTTTVNKNEVIPRTAIQQIIKNKTEIAQTSTSNSDKFTVFYYDENGKMHHLGEFSGETEDARDRAFEKAFALAEENAREHNHADVHYGKKKFPVKKSTSKVSKTTESPLVTPEEESLAAQRRADLLSAAADAAKGKTKAQVSPVVTAMVAPQQPTPQENAVQEQITDEGVLRQERPEMELQGMGEQNVQPQETATEGQIQEEVIAAPGESEQGTLYGKPSKLTDKDRSQAVSLAKTLQPGDVVETNDGQETFRYKVVVEDGTRLLRKIDQRGDIIEGVREKFLANPARTSSQGELAAIPDGRDTIDVIARGRIIRSGTEIQPTIQVATERDLSKPEQMNPDEFTPIGNPVNQGIFKSKKEASARLAELEDTISKSPQMMGILSEFNLTPSDAYEVAKDTRGRWSLGATHKHRVALAARERLPVSAAAVDAYQITLPEGYVRQGDLYVFQPQTTAAETQTPESLRVDSGAAGVVQSEPSRGSILEVEKESAKTAIESTEKSLEDKEKSGKAESIILDDVTKKLYGIRGGIPTKDAQTVLQQVINATSPIKGSSAQFARALLSKFPSLNGTLVVSFQQFKNAMASLLYNNGKHGFSQEESFSAVNDFLPPNMDAFYDPFFDAVVLLDGKEIGPSVVAHEIGHAIEDKLFKDAPEKTRSDIIDAFNKHIARVEKQPIVTDYLPLFEIWYGSDKARPYSPDMPIDLASTVDMEYLKSFKEWFANQVAKWATSYEKPLSLVDKFFSSVASKIKELFNVVKGYFSPETSVVDYIHSLATSDMRSDIFLPKKKKQVKKQSFFDKMVPDSMRGLAQQGVEVTTSEKAKATGYAEKLNSVRKLLRTGSNNTKAQNEALNDLMAMPLADLQAAFEVVTGIPTKLANKRQLANNVLNEILAESRNEKLPEADETFRKAEIEAEEEERREAAMSYARLHDKERSSNIVTGKVTMADARQAAGLLQNNGISPNAAFTWMGTVDDLLALKNTPFGESHKKLIEQVAANKNIEGTYSNGTAFVFVDQVVVSNLDRRKAKELGISEGVAAAMRVIDHENGHFGMDILSAGEKARIMAFLRTQFTPESLDALAYSRYPSLRKWRTNPESEMRLLDERLRQYIEETKTIPTDGVWKQFWDYIKAIWRKWTGKPQGEPTLQSMKDVVRLIRKALKDAHKQRPDQTKGGDRVLMSYAGEKAIENLPKERRQFMRDSLDAAKAMAAAGKSSEEIRAATGWFPGKYDGKMRFEIVDDKAAYREKIGAYTKVKNWLYGKLSEETMEGTMVGIPLRQILDFPELYDAYPQIKKIKVDLEDRNGAAFIPESNTIALSLDDTPAKRLSYLLHELQHWIQTHEGFAKGGSPKGFGFISKQAFDEYQRIAGEIEARDVQARKDLTPEQRKAVAPYSSENIAQEDAIVLFGGGPQMSVSGISQFVPAVNLNGRIETGTPHYEAWLKHAIRQIPSYKKDGLSDSEVKDLADRWLVDHPEAMANSMTKEGFVTDEGYLNRQDSLKKFLALGGKQRLDPGEVRDWLDSSDLEDARFSISYASETSQASSLGQQTAREMTASPRKLEAIIGVRQAYESMPKVHGNAVSLAELFDAAAKIVPNLTQVEFNSVVQGMYEDNAALLDNAETPSSIVILPNGAMMSVAGGANDAEYLAAVEAGDMKKAQRMVDEAAKAAGYEVKAFHGTPSGGFNTFDSAMKSARDSGWLGAAFYFTKSRDVAKNFQAKRKGFPTPYGVGKASGPVSRSITGQPQIYEVFVRGNNPVSVKRIAENLPSAVNASRKRKGLPEKSIEQPDISGLNDIHLANLISEYGSPIDLAVSLGYDSLVADMEGGTIAVSEPWQIKSAAPVTYDDAGNVIPLSQRFQTASPDIRFSIASTPEQQSAAAKFKSAIIEAAKGTNKQRDYEGRPIKDRIINPLSSDVQDFVEIGQHNTVAFGAFMDAADEMLESMVKDGMSLDEILSKIQSSSFQQELGMFTVEAGQGMAMRAVMGLLLRKTANAERSAKTKAEKIESSMLHRKAANYFTAVASTPSGQNLYALQALYNDPRTRFIFMENRALADMLKKADHGVNMRFDGAYGATQEATDTNVNASATAATKNIADQAEEAEEDDQDAIDLAAGEATLTDKQKSAWERFKDAIRTKGLIAKALQAIRSGNKARASISAADRNAIFQMTEEELLALDAKMDKIMLDAEEVFFAESDAATRKKREKMAQTAQKRAQKGKEIEVTPTSLGKIINQARRDIKGPTGKPIQWREIFRQPAKSVEEFRKNILLAIMGNDAFKDMDDAQKRQIADMFAEAWGKEREKVLNQLQKRHEDNLEAQGKREAAKALREARNQILEIANLGVFSNDELTRILGEKFGFKTSFTEAEQQKLSELAEKIQDESLSKPVRNKLAREFLATLQSGTQISIAELLSNWWVASVLSGGNTITAIALSFTNGTGIGILGTHIARAIRNMVKGDTAGAIEAITSMFKAYAKHIASFPSAANRAWNYLWTGDVSLLEASANDPFKNVRSLADIARYQIVADQVAKDPNKVKAVMGRFMQFMGRLLSALDAFNVMITKAGTTSLAIRQSGLTADQIRDAELKNDLKFYKDKIIREDPYFNGKAPTSSFDKAYLASLAEAALYKDLAEFGVKMENADYLAAEAAMTMTPTGVGGIVYNKIKALDKDITTESRERLKQAEKAWAAEKDIDTGLKLFTWRALNFLAEQGINALGLRFARFAGNKFNQSLSYIPVLGALRVFETGNKELAGREEAFKDTIIRNQTIGFIMIIAGMKIIEAIADEPDDKKRGWFINGGWNNLTPDQKKQRLSLGEKQYTIGIGDQVFNYQNWPIGQAIAAIGELSDMIRFSPEKWKEKTTVGKFGSSLVSGMTSALEIPALTQVGEIFGNTMAAKDPSEQTISRLSRVMAGWAGGFMPRFLKDIDYMLKPEMRKYESFYEKAASHIPIYRSYVGKEYYDILGNQIKKNAIPGSRDFDRLAQEPEYKLLGALNARGIWLTPANAEYRMIGKGRYRRRLTQEEADRYSLETGKLYKQMIMRFGPRALQMPVEQAKDYISAKADDMRDLALLKAVRN